MLNYQRVHLTQRRQIREQPSVSRSDFCFKLCFKLFKWILKDLKGSSLSVTVLEIVHPKLVIVENLVQIILNHTGYRCIASLDNKRLPATKYCEQWRCWNDEPTGAKKICLRISPASSRLHRSWFTQCNTQCKSMECITTCHNVLHGCEEKRRILELSMCKMFLGNGMVVAKWGRMWVKICQNAWLLHLKVNKKDQKGIKKASKRHQRQGGRGSENAQSAYLFLGHRHL